MRTVTFFRYLGMEQDQDQDLTKKLTGARVDPHQKSVLSLRCVVPLSVSAGNSICNLEPIVTDDLHAKSRNLEGIGTEQLLTTTCHICQVSELSFFIIYDIL